MKARKRVLSVLLIIICAAVMAVSFTACNSFGSSSVEKDPNAHYQDSKIKVTDMTYDNPIRPLWKDIS